MSNYKPSWVSEREQPPPKLEPWLLMCLLAMLPAVLIVMLPGDRLAPLLVPIVGSMVALLVIGLAMLWRKERQSGTERREGREGREVAEASEAVDGLELRRREA
jgi:undecaprenyl pyrophosphate phosphatase UppP